jgi:hypothetical protein
VLGGEVGQFVSAPVFKYMQQHVNR